MDKIYSDYAEWLAACEKLALRGPYRVVSGNRNIIQFVDDAGTAAMWNAASGSGVLMRGPCPMCGKEPCACPRWGGMLEGMNKDELAAYDFGCRSMEGALRAILDGEDRGEGVANEPWETLRRRVLALVNV